MTYLNQTTKKLGLVVDDDRISQRVVKGFLEEQSYHVIIANNGHEALRIIDTSNLAFDVIVMDINMPIVGGLEATKRIRATKKVSKKLPIIGMSTDSDAKTLNAGLEAGMDAILAKPIRYEVFKKLIA